VTLLFGAKDIHHNEAVVLEEVLKQQISPARELAAK
jgi:uncharacterized protein YeaO (DUF488 family)